MCTNCRDRNKTFLNRHSIAQVRKSGKFNHIEIKKKEAKYNLTIK
jgi:hypothetical protein